MSNYIFLLPMFNLLTSITKETLKGCAFLLDFGL